ncbi:MAG: hypothetical protein QME76_07205 [Bacillota bacterium]|nr:hypothetical protein [Bacillota bacterium]
MDEARHRFYPVLYRGVMNFGIIVGLLLLLMPAEGRVFLGVLSGNNVSDLSGARLVFWITAFYFPAVIMGLVEYVADVRFAFFVKASRAWRNFLIRNTAFEISPRDDMFWDLFLCYRAVGKRPVVRVLMGEGKGGSDTLRGEVLKVNWGLRPGMMLADMDAPQNMSWVPIRDVKAVVFENPGVLPECRVLDPKTRELLNLIHPGYGDEVEERYRPD